MAQSALTPSLLEQAETDPERVFLRELPGYADPAGRYRAKM